ncbi:MAG: preprotein translocase subunit SecE, partial [Isosphaeraceae bacterium]
MGKVKDGAPAKAQKPSKGGTAGGSRRQVVQFFTNLLTPELYKPKQGWNARLWTAIGLGVIILLGLVRLFEAIKDDYTTVTSYGIVTGLGLAFGWFIFRLVEFPPFVEFLIATEAEMNKVSWTSKDDLKRATSVVLVTVTLMAIYLFLVDWVWANLLQLLGIL